MSGEPAAVFRPAGAAGVDDLVPRFEEQGYSDEALAARRQWVEGRTGARRGNGVRLGMVVCAGLGAPGREG